MTRYLGRQPIQPSTLIKAWHFKQIFMYDHLDKDFIITYNVYRPAKLSRVCTVMH